MIVTSLPQLLADGKGVINSAKLYDIYTGAWVDREARKGEFRKLIRKEQKLRFMEELALQLFAEDRDSIHCKHLGLPIKEFFKVDDSDQADFFSHDIRTCAFLRRNSGSEYEFVHRSFQEFFLAKKLISEATIGIRNAWGYDLPVEVIRFTAELLDKKSDAAIVAQLLGWAAQEPRSPLGRNCVSVASLCGQPIPSIIAEAYGMPSETLESAVAYQMGDSDGGRMFGEFVYLRATQRVKAFLMRELRDDLIEGHDIVHEEFLSVMNTLIGKPLQTAAEIDQLIVTSIRWSSIGESGGEATKRGYRDLLEGVRDESYQIEEASHTASPEDIVLAREIMTWMRTAHPRIAELLWRYFVIGESWAEIASDTGKNPKALRVMLSNGLQLVRQELDRRK